MVTSEAKITVYSSLQCSRLSHAFAVSCFSFHIFWLQEWPFVEHMCTLQLAETTAVRCGARADSKIGNFFFFCAPSLPIAAFMTALNATLRCAYAWTDGQTYSKQVNIRHIEVGNWSRKTQPSQ